MEARILFLPGDGIGPEVCAQAQKVLDWINRHTNVRCDYEKALIGGAAIDFCGDPLPKKTLDLAQKSDAVLLGAVGGPNWDQGTLRPEQGLLRIREALEVYTNLRPALSFPTLAQASSLKSNLVQDLDVMVVRELTGGIYFGQPRYLSGECPSRVAVNTMVYHEYEIERIARRAFEVARGRSKRLCSVDKANVLEVSQLWRSVVTQVGEKDYSDVKLEHLYVDNAVMQLIANPKQFDVILSSNLFGDILSDAAAMLTGSIGMLPSACIGDKQLALYEPVHGSAPDLAGKNRANPLAAVLSLAMLYRHSFNENGIALRIENAVRSALQLGNRTADIAASSESFITTEQMGDAVVEALEQS